MNHFEELVCWSTIAIIIITTIAYSIVLNINNLQITELSLQYRHYLHKIPASLLKLSLNLSQMLYGFMIIMLHHQFWAKIKYPILYHWSELSFCAFISLLIIDSIENLLSKEMTPGIPPLFADLQIIFLLPIFFYKYLCLLLNLNLHKYKKIISIAFDKFSIFIDYE